MICITIIWRSLSLNSIFAENLELRQSEWVIWWDIIKLPFPVLLKRVYKRLRPGREGSLFKYPRIDSNLKWPLSIPNSQPSSTQKFVGQKYLHHDFSYLGSGWCSIKASYAPPGFLEWRYQPKPTHGEELDWLRDQRSGFSFHRNTNPAEALQTAFQTSGVDVKFCWEFARFHHFPQLAIAARRGLISPSEVLNKATLQLRSFYNQAPYGKGVHYASPMEVAIRMVNLLIAHHLRSEILPGELHKNLCSEHWHYLCHHLEHKEGLGTNHYLSNLMALVVAGYYMDSRQVESTARWAWQEFEKEFHKQFFSDGGNFEYSIYYHRLSTEITLLTLSFARAQGFPTSESSVKLLRKALALLHSALKPDDTLPQFGDNDSGRILDLKPEGVWKGKESEPHPGKTGFIRELKDTETLYGAFYSQLLGELHGQIIAPEKQKPLESFNLAFSTELPYEKETVFSFEEIDREQIKRTSFPETGLYFFKSEEFYLAINLMSNPRGHRYRGHRHNDLGQFELTVHGNDLVSDPGTLSYTASVELRNRYRSTRAHFVPYVGKEQNRFLNNATGLFHNTFDTTAELLIWEEYCCVFQVKYRGVRHIRRIAIEKNRVVISDWCNYPFSLQDDADIKFTDGYGKLKKG